MIMIIMYAMRAPSACCKPLHPACPAYTWRMLRVPQRLFSSCSAKEPPSRAPLVERCTPTRLLWCNATGQLVMITWLLMVFSAMLSYNITRPG